MVEKPVRPDNRSAFNVGLMLSVRRRFSSMKDRVLSIFIFFCFVFCIGGEGRSEPESQENGDEAISYLVLHARESCLCVDPELLEKYEDRTPRIRIIPSRQKDSGYNEGIPGLFLSDWPPDMIQMESGYFFRQLVKQGKLKRSAIVLSGNDEGLLLPFLGGGDGSDYMASIWRNWSGLLYHPGITEAFSSDVPSEWTLFLELCKSIKETGVAPLYTDLGIENTFFWFDYLDIRINGADFHSRLLSGEVAFSSPEMEKVFALWLDLIKEEFFFFDNESDWNEVYRKKEASFFPIHRGEWIDSLSDLTTAPGLCEFPHFMYTFDRGEIAPASGLVFPFKSTGKKEIGNFLFYLRESVKQESLRSRYYLDLPTEDNFRSAPVLYFNHFYKEVPPEYSQQLGDTLVGIWTIKEDEAIQSLSEDMDSIRTLYY